MLNKFKRVIGNKCFVRYLKLEFKLENSIGTLRKKYKDDLEHEMKELLKKFYQSFFGDIITKRASRYFLIQRFARRNGFNLEKMNVLYRDDFEFRSIIDHSPFVFNNKSFALYYLAKGISHVIGDTCECGVYKGRGSYCILKAIRNRSYTHHVFDSFEGLSEPTGEDNTDLNISNWQKGDLNYGLNLVAENLKEFDNVKYYEGWIPTRFHEVKDNRFSLIHIDVDLFQPTLDSLEFFYERVNKGGLIICDDYGSKDTPGAKKAMNRFFSDKPENIVFLPVGIGFVIKQ